MQSAQRIFLVISVILVLITDTVVLYRKKEEKLQIQWEHIQAERLLGRICRNGKVSLEEYMQCSSALNRTGSVAKVILEEYQIEEDMAGEKYYYLVSWEELEECFVNEGMCSFQAQSIIKVSVEQSRLGKSSKRSYYGMIQGKD